MLFNKKDFDAEKAKLEQEVALKAKELEDYKKFDELTKEKEKLESQIKEFQQRTANLEKEVETLSLKPLNEGQTEEEAKQNETDLSDYIKEI